MRVSIVNQRGEPFRLVVDGSHTLVMQLDLTGDLDCDYGNNNQHHEQYEATQKTLWGFPDPVLFFQERLA